MIRVTVELWVQGDESNKKTLGVVDIANDLTGTLSRGNYRVKQLDRNARTVQRGYVPDHPRREVSVWKLVAKALASVGHPA